MEAFVGDDSGGTMKRFLISCIAATVLAASLAAVPGAWADGHYVATEVTFPSEDGTMLYAQVFRPADFDDSRKTPVVLVTTPYQLFLAPNTGPQLLYTELDEEMKLFEKGYSIVQVSLRGYGESEGCGDFGGPGEQADARAAVEWSASQPWSTGKVGTYGISYDAWTQVMAMAGKAKGLSASVVSSPLISAYRGLYQERIHYSGGWHATPILYGGIDVTSPGAPTPDSPTCYPINAYETARSEPDTPYWDERDLIARASKSDVPTFWSFGFLDPQTKPDNFLDVYSKLDGYKRAWFGQFVHRIPGPQVGNKYFAAQVVRFFDRHLKGKKTPHDPRVEVQEGQTGTWRVESSWPPKDGAYHQLPIKEGVYQDLERDDSGAGEERGTWTFSQPLPYAVHLSGVTRFKVKVNALGGGVHVHARLFDVSGSVGTLIARGAKLVGDLPTEPVDGTVRFETYPQDYVIPAGHRIGILMSGADNAWFDPGTTGFDVTVSGSLSIPFLEFRRAMGPPTPSSDMGTRATLSIATDHIKERTVKMPLPPRLR